MIISSLDIAIIAIYCVLLIVIAWYVSREKQGHQKDTADYFLAGRSLPWWAIGASLVAANISAEQIIGMSGSGYAIGLAIASYEWMAALTLLIVAKYFLPIFLKKSIFTMPQFLEDRFDHRVRVVMAFFWLTVYVFVNLTSVLYLGALAINAITGFSMTAGMLFLVGFSLAYSIYGGLKAVAMTDVIQVTLLIVGGMIVTWLSLDAIGGGNGVAAGLSRLIAEAPDKFELILSSDHPHYASLPGISVLVGGMWVMNFSYWGFNQYITQRALAAKSLKEAQKGVAFAAYLKLLTPLIVVVPGIAAALLAPDLARPDQAYPEMMKLVPQGILGLTSAALIAAIASSLSSMSNSISTLFTMDIYKDLINREASEYRLVIVGRIAAISAMALAVIIAQPLLGQFDQAFQYIQEFTGFFTPGIVSIFLFGFFWKKATANAALAMGIGSALLSLALKLAVPSFPFMDRVGLVFVTCIVVGYAVTKLEHNDIHPKAIDLTDIDFSTTRGFNASTVGVCLVLVALYASWW